MSRTSARVIQPSSRNKSAKKPVCNEQTFSSMFRKTCIKHFHNSRDTDITVFTRRKALIAMARWVRALSCIKAKSLDANGAILAAKSSSKVSESLLVDFTIIVLPKQSNCSHSTRFSRFVSKSIKPQRNW